MIPEILITAALIWYLFAEGLTEGYSWATVERRKTNKLIKPKDVVNDYHSWRTFGENVGITGAVIAAAYAGPTLAAALAVVAGWLLGLFIYDKALHYVTDGEASPEYHIAGFTLPRWGSWWQYLKLGVGTAAFVGMFFV